MPWSEQTRRNRATSHHRGSLGRHSKPRTIREILYLPRGDTTEDTLRSRIKYTLQDSRFPDYQNIRKYKN